MLSTINMQLTAAHDDLAKVKPEMSEKERLALILSARGHLELARTMLSAYVPNSVFERAYQKQNLKQLVSQISQIDKLIEQYTESLMFMEALKKFQ